MFHTTSEAATGRPRTSAGQSAPSAGQSALSAGQSAHSGIAIAFPQICQARPAIAEPLELLRLAALQESLGATPTLARERLLQCAHAVFRELQALLHEHEGTQLHGRVRREIWDAQGMALLALPGSLGELKRLQLKAGSGRPLTVCFGNRARDHLLDPPFDHIAYPEGDGCGLVHLDSPGLQRPNFHYYCPTCRTRLTTLVEQSRAEALARSQHRFLYLAYDEHGQASPAWVGPCSSCEKEFVTSNARVQRCEHCRGQHRGPKANPTRANG